MSCVPRLNKKEKVSGASVSISLCFMVADTVSLNLNPGDAVLGTVPNDMEVSNDAGNRNN